MKTAECKSENAKITAASLVKPAIGKFSINHKELHNVRKAIEYCFSPNVIP
jgi:hypothetical protein